MATLSDLSTLLPRTFCGFLTPERTNPQRLAPWIDAVGSMQIGDIERVCESFFYTDDRLFLKPLSHEVQKGVSKLIDANGQPLQLMSDSSKMLSFVTLPIALDDLARISEKDYELLESQMSPLLVLQVMKARYLICLGKHSDALRQTQNVFRTATQLLNSSIPGEVNHQGFFQLHAAYLTALELADVVDAGQEAIVTDLITAMEECQVHAVDYVRTQLMPFCVNIIHAAWNFPNTNDIAEILQYLWCSRHLKASLIPASAEDIGSAFIVADTQAQRQEKNDDYENYIAWLVANHLVEDNPLPFDKSAALSEICNTFSEPWSEIDKKPGEVRRLCVKNISREFYPGLHNFWPSVIVQGGYVASNAWNECDANSSNAERFFRNTPNSIGKSLCFEVRRLFFQELAQTMGCWYSLRLVREATRSLLGIKAFALRMGKLPTSMSEMVESGAIGSMPEDPYSRTALEYLPNQKVVRVDPSSNEFEKWETGRSRHQTFVWRVLKCPFN